jgi:signal transduction histidine kinase
MRLPGLSHLRDLSLKGKVTLTLTVVFAAAVAVFLLVQIPAQREQRRRLLDQEKRLVSTLTDGQQRYFIFDIISQSQDSLSADLASLTRQPGILWARIEAPGIDLQATADRETIRRLLGEGAAPRENGAGPPALLIDRDRRARVVGPAGETLVEGGELPPSALPRWPRTPPTGAFAELEWEGGSVLFSSTELKAADETYGRLYLLYSLASIHEGEARARAMFYGFVGTAFALLLLLLNLLIARIVIVPLRRVMQAMSEASKGDMGVRLQEHSADELGTMAASFNRMASELETSRREIEEYSRNLEAMVEERTRALRESEEHVLLVKNHLATVIASVATGVVSLDGEGRVTTFNDRAAEILGVSRGRGEGETLETLCGPGEARRLADFVADVPAGACPSKKGQIVVRLPQGRRTLSVVASTLPGEGGKRMGTVVVFDDLTQILATQRLEAWKEAVERVIHEIKNPLTPVGLAAQTMKSAFGRDRAKFDEIFPSATEMILRAVSDLKELIAEFARFSRLPKLALRHLDLNALVRDVVAPYEHGAIDGIRVISTFHPGPLEIEADPDQLRRVLLNVMNNGLDAMGGRGGELRVTTEVEADPARVRIEVRDQGLGVDDVERIFEPHYTTKVKGTGLGLAITRQIVEEHGGEIQVESPPGQGTTVTILLPAVPPPRA